MIRFALKEEKAIIKAMWEAIFPEDGQGYIDYYFDSIYHESNCLVSEDDGQIVSSLQINPKQLSIGPHVMSASYIVGICTVEEYRHQGYMQELLEVTFDFLRQRDQLVLLQTNRPEMYFQYGFEEAYFKAHYLIRSAHLESIESYLKVDVLTVEHINSMVRVYADYTHKKDGFALRDDRYYHKLFEHLEVEEATCLGCFRGADFLGYLYYKRVGHIVYVPEVIYKNELALLTMLRVMATKGRMVQVSLDPSNDLDQLVKCEKKMVKPYAMVKLLDPLKLSQLVKRPIKRFEDLLEREAFMNEEF